MHSIRLSKCLLVLVATLLFATQAAAQAAATAEMHVSVKDPKGAVVKNATVHVRSEATGFERSTTQNMEGEYSFLLLPPGLYTLTVEAPGFAKTIAKDVAITIGQRAEVPITLQLATVQEVVNVTTEAELIETQRTAPTTTIDQVRIDNLPINGRNYINFTLTDSKVARDTAPSIGAAPTSGLNFGGQRARANLVNVDGADAVDNSVNGIRSTVSQEAVQEFQIIQNSYTAEYGRASGGIVNIISRSGSNAFHGNAFGYLRNRNIQAVNPFSTVKDPAYTRVQAGLTAGGPIKKDKTFFFFAYETTRRRETGFSSIGANNFDLVPFSTVPLTPFLGGVNFGTVQLTADQVAFVGRLAAAIPTVPAAQQPALASLLGQYLVAAGGGAGIAVNGALPSPVMAGAIAAKFSGAGSVTPGYTVIPRLDMWPSSGFPLPASFVPLNSIRGNFPVTELTSIASLRLDHRINNNQSLMLRGSYSPSTVTGIQVNAQGPQNFGQNAFSRTSENDFHDVSGLLQHTWSIGSNKVNEFRFQGARRGLRYNFSHSPGGSGVAVNIPGYAFFGREPFSFVDRVEQRYQFTDNFSLTRGKHNFKWGADFNYLPLTADFTVNFGGVVNMGGLSASQLSLPSSIALPSGALAIPSLTAVQAYGLGIPQYELQGVGNPHDSFSNKILGVFIQDSWRVRPNLTVNYGVRYDVEFTPTFKAINAISQAAENALGITQGIPRDTNNVAPRIGIAWDPRNNGKTVLRASYGMFYDHPLLALAFDSDVADGSQAPQVLLLQNVPGVNPQFGLVSCLSAPNAFQGILGLPICQPALFNYLANEQRFNTTPNAPSVFVGQQYLSTTPPVPLTTQPFGFPVAKNFQYAYSQQANLTFEQDMGHNLALSLEYNFNGGRHLNRPININAVRSDLIVTNFTRAVAGITALNNALAPFGVAVPLPSSPVTVAACPTLIKAQVAAAAPPLAPLLPGIKMTPLGNWTSAPLVSFFRPSGLNPSLAPKLPFAACMGEAQAALTEFHLGFPVPVPFSDAGANFSNGSSVYHGFSANLRKRFSSHYEFLASYTWSHAIDDSTDLETPLAPQDNYHPNDDRSNSTFDQRHRFVFSSVLQTGRLAGNGFLRKFFSDWTFAPILDVSSGRPFNIITGTDRNFDFGSTTDRPIASTSATNACGDPAFASRFSPTGFFQPACFLNGTLVGNVGRNSGVKPWTVFSDLRVARRIRLGERIALDGIMDVFNLPNRFNVADVNPLYTDAGRPTAASDPRQFQFALKLSW